MLSVAASGFVIQVKDMAAYLATILIDKGFMIFFFSDNWLNFLAISKLSTLERILGAVKRTSTKLQMRSCLATQYDLT